jgi:hypothetical protein
VSPIDSRNVITSAVKIGIRRALFILLISVADIGCDSPDPSGLVEATGTVTYEGRPLEGANVLFQPQGGNEPSLASQSVTDGDGRFRLSTHIGAGKFQSGIAPGRYGVAITKLDTASNSSTLAPPKHLLPKKYATPPTSGLVAEVAAGRENDFRFVIENDEDRGPTRK